MKNLLMAAMIVLGTSFANAQAGQPKTAAPAKEVKTEKHAKQAVKEAKAEAKADVKAAKKEVKAAAAEGKKEVKAAKAAAAKK